MAESDPSRTAGQWTAKLLRAVRKQRGWTQQKLAERLGENGLPMDRATIAKIEQGGTRATNLPLEDLLALAVALGVNPIELFVPREDSQILKVGQTNIGSVQARSWLRQREPLREADSKVYWREVPDDEWQRIVELAGDITVPTSVTGHLTVTGDGADTDRSDK